MTKIKYNIEDLNNNSGSLLDKYDAMNEAATNLNKLTESIGAHWTGTDSTAYITALGSSVTTLNTYLTTFKTIASNLATAASYYQTHEEKYNVNLW